MVVPLQSSSLSGKEKLLEIREELGDQLVKESSRVIELEILVQKMQTEIAVLKGQVNIQNQANDPRTIGFEITVLKGR
jgi:hypothetical protein